MSEFIWSDSFLIDQQLTDEERMVVATEESNVYDFSIIETLLSFLDTCCFIILLSFFEVNGRQ